jgi:hypothetical protein
MVPLRPREARDATLQCRLAHGQPPVPGCHRQRAEVAAVASSPHRQSPPPRPAPPSLPVADPAVGTSGPCPGTQEAPPTAVQATPEAAPDAPTLLPPRKKKPPPRAASPVAARHRTGCGGAGSGNRSAGRALTAGATTGPPRPHGADPAAGAPDLAPRRRRRRATSDINNWFIVFLNKVFKL